MHLLRILAATAALVLCTVMPFLPGGYDRLAVPLSAMAQMAGTAGLAVVPFAALWLAAERWPRLASWRFALAVLSLIVTTLVWTLTAIVAAIHSGVALALATLVSLGLTARTIRPVLLERNGASRGTPQALPIYLVFVPSAAALLQLALLEPAVAYSRNLAISNAAPLIAEIEHYRVARGHYPPSLLSVNRDYSPGVIGIERYHYEPHGAAYNLVFEQFSPRFGTREFVVYNPRDEQAVTAHASDLLQLTPEQLRVERGRGHYDVRAAPALHWKYFWFD